MALTAGSTLGPYIITADLGHGGMGVVYTAQDPHRDRQVAIKLLPPDLTRDETAKQRFLQEAKGGAGCDSQR
jgi:serine/threonine-protein kinase